MIFHINAIETVNAFPTMESLVLFRKWAHQQIDVEELNPIQQEYAHKHSNLRKTWRVSDQFPSPMVVEAYLRPTVDDSREKFTWGRPNLAGLRKFCVDKLDYTLQKADEVLAPVMKSFDTRTAQTRMDSFVTAERAAVIQSARIAKAVKSLRQGRALSKDMAIHAATAFASGEGDAGDEGEQGSSAVQPPPKKQRKKAMQKAPDDSTKPKRIKTAYFLFLDDFRASFKEKVPHALSKDVAKAAGARWKEMSVEEKAFYQGAYAKLKAERVQTPPDVAIATPTNPEKADRGVMVEQDDDEDDDFVPGVGQRKRGVNSSLEPKQKRARSSRRAVESARTIVGESDSDEEEA